MIVRHHKFLENLRVGRANEITKNKIEQGVFTSKD